MADSSTKPRVTARKRRLGDLNRMLEVLRAHGVSEFTDGEMTVKFPPPSLDVEAIAAALDKVRAGEGLDDLPARKFSDGDRDDRRRLPRGEDAS